MNKLFLKIVEKILKSDNPSKELQLFYQYLEEGLIKELSYYKELMKEAGYE